MHFGEVCSLACALKGSACLGAFAVDGGAAQLLLFSLWLLCLIRRSAFPLQLMNEGMCLWFGRFFLAVPRRPTSGGVHDLFWHNVRRPVQALARANFLFGGDSLLQFLDS